MIRTPPQRFLLAPFLALLTACEAPAAPLAPSTPELNGSATITRTVSVVLSTNVVAGCVGEIIEFHLRTQFRVAETTDATGTHHQVTGSTDQGSTGIGLTTGTVYRTVSVGTASAPQPIDGTDGDVLTLAATFVVVGGGHRLVLHETVHYTLTPTGEVAVSFASASLQQCT